MIDLQDSGQMAAQSARQARAGPGDGPVELTILMPCLNEAETIAVCVQKATEFLKRTGISGEVVIADNGSTDGSQALATDLGARVVPVPVRGYGAAIIGGIAAARGKYIIMGDADDSYDFSRLELFVEKLRTGADIVMGNRFKGGIAKGAMPPLHRMIGNPVLSWVGRVLFKIPVGDFHCGLRGFSTESIRKLNLVTSGMEFASEMVIRSSLAQFKMEEVPTTLQPDGRTRAPHLKTWRDGWRHLKLLLMYSPKWLFLFPGLVLMLASVIMQAALWFGPVSLSPNLSLDLNSYAASCFTLIAGVQLFGFGVLARYYATLTGLLPRGKRSDLIYRFATTDTIVRIGAIALLLGVVIFGYAVSIWAHAGFGELTDSPHVMRAVLSGLSLIVISMQLGFGAFLIGILRMPLLARGISATTDSSEASPDASGA